MDGFDSQVHTPELRGESRFGLRSGSTGFIRFGMNKIVWGTTIIAVSLMVGCTVAPAERTNLDVHKQGLVMYVDSGDYGREIAAVAARADAWVEQRAAMRRAGERLMVVFDLDDTLISGWPYMKSHSFGWDDASWQQWVDAADGMGIEPICALFRKARRLGIEVAVLTARPERDRTATAKNLRAIGCGDYVTLICKSADSPPTAAAFKSRERRRLSDEGNVIIAMIGDQESDLAGGYAERTFKLPNPFYVTP